MTAMRRNFKSRRITTALRRNGNRPVKLLHLRMGDQALLSRGSVAELELQVLQEVVDGGIDSSVGPDTESLVVVELGHLRLILEQQMRTRKVCMLHRVGHRDGRSG